MTEVAIRTNDAAPAFRLFSPLALLADLAPHRRLIWLFVRREFAQRYRGATLGSLWAVLQPLLILGVYTLVFSVVLQIEFDSGITGNPQGDFVLFFFCGWIAFTLFAECAGQAPISIVRRQNLVTKVVFPLQILPVVMVGSALLRAVIGYCILLVAVVIITGRIPITALYLPVVLVPLVIFTLGAAWLLAALGVFWRDVRQVIPAVIRLLLFLTPVFYPLALVLRRTPEKYHWVLYLNPLTTVIESTRACVLVGRHPDFAALGILTLVSLVVLQLGYALFSAWRKDFSDVV